MLNSEKHLKSFEVKKDLRSLSEDLKTKETGEKFVKLKIDIIDSGVGIKKENLGKLFMEFGKLDEHSKVNA